MRKTERKGIYNGYEYTFTHRNPKTGEWYTPDTQKGSWIKGEKIKWLRK